MDTDPPARTAIGFGQLMTQQHQAAPRLTPRLSLPHNKGRNIEERNIVAAIVVVPAHVAADTLRGEPAMLHTRIQLEPGARLEWLPPEAICYSASLAENRLQMALAPGSERIGRDVHAREQRLRQQGRSPACRRGTRPMQLAHSS